MADYYPLIARAIAGLDPNAPGESRRALYERARTALIAQLRSVQPPLSESEITRERLSLPGDVAGWLEGRSRFARLGLMIHVTSGFVAPGVVSRQVLEMSNVAGRSLAIRAGVRICQVVLQRCEGSAVYQGRFARQESL